MNQQKRVEGGGGKHAYQLVSQSLSAINTPTSRVSELAEKTNERTGGSERARGYSYQIGDTMYRINAFSEGSGVTLIVLFG